MSKNFIKIIRFGLIGEMKNGGKYRNVVFEDLSNKRTADYIVYLKQRPMLWSDIEKLEQGGTLPPYRGFITQYEGSDIVVFGNESLEEAFAKQKHKPVIKENIRRSKANHLLEKSTGYITNLTTPGCLEISWRQIDPEARIIRFRYYKGKGVFIWSHWYKISD